MIAHLLANATVPFNKGVSMSKLQTRVLLVYAIFVALCSSYDNVFAAKIDLTSDTHLQFREDARNNNFATLRQYIDFNAIDIDGRLSLYSSGWFRYELDSTEDGDRENDEILYAYITYSPLQDRRLLLNFGRLFVFEGLASEQIDGVSARWEIVPLIGVSAFGGVPVETDFDGRDADYIFGGRVFLRVPQRAEIGWSFLQEGNDDSSYREELGVDVWVLPLQWMELQGHSFWNEKTDGWMEHAYTLRVFPLEKVILSTFVSHTDYDDAFSPTTLRAFFPAAVGDGEELTKVGTSVEYQVNTWLAGVADYTRYEYDIQGSADFFGGNLTAHVPLHGFAAGVSIHRMHGETKRLRYLKVRTYVTKTFQALEVSLDTVHLSFDESFSGINHVYSFSGALAYKLTSSLLASTSLYYSKNPDFDQEAQAFLKIVYNFGKEI
jgi:hypothetical protein